MNAGAMREFATRSKREKGGKVAWKRMREAFVAGAGGGDWAGFRHIQKARLSLSWPRPRSSSTINTSRQLG